MSYIIKHVSIKGLWNIKSFDTDFHRNINILIGQNGSNKTILLNLIEACLMADFRILQQIDFDTIQISLENDNGEFKSIRIKRKYDDNWIVFTYTIDKENIEIRTLGEFDDHRFHMGMPGIMREQYIQVRTLLGRLVNMSWLSVDRYTENDEERRGFRSVVEKKLIELIRELSVYRLKLYEGTNKLTRELNTEVLSLLLYDDKTDNFDMGDIERFASLDAREIKASLYRVFNQMGNMRQMSERIQNHIAKLTGAIERVKARESLRLNDVSALVLISKTLSLIDLSRKHKDAVDLLMEPIDTYINTLKNFIRDKNFNFSEESGQLEVEWVSNSKNKGNTSILKYNSLSSGEKQLLILLTQTLLQEKLPYIFIADEPELSLHIEWQRNIISAINILNPNAQIIVATHSPEIAGNFPDNIINMRSITSYE